MSNMKLTPQYAIAELQDGTVTEPMRIMQADKLALERTAKAQGWDLAEDGITTNVFLAWRGATRAGYTQAQFEDFSNQLVDLSIVNGEPLDPTPRAQ